MWATTFGYDPEATKAKAKSKLYKLDYQLRSFCKEKGTSNRHPTEREKIFTRTLTDKGLISRLYEEPKNT